MNRILATLMSTAIALLALSAMPVLAQSANGEHKFIKAAGYYTECKGATEAKFEEIKPKLRAFTDAEIMAETVNDPEKFFALMDVVNDPHTIHVMSRCATEPVMWNTWMRGLTNPTKMTAAMVKSMNPAGMMKWMMAPANPKLWNVMMSQFSGEKIQKWSVAAVNPTFYNPITVMADPNWYAPRLEWMANPASYAPMFAMFGMAAPATN